MTVRRAIVIAIDGLRASALGAYGNAWYPTPELDRLASESRVFDWLIADSPQLAGFYRAAWRGVGPISDGVEPTCDDRGDEAAALSGMLEAAGVKASLTTDDSRVAQWGDRLGFSEVRSLEFPHPLPAESVADTELAQLLTIAAQQIERWKSSDAGDAPQLLWIHARGFYGAWDAPLELRQSLLDEDDPPAAGYVLAPPRHDVEEHDELLLHRVAYAAQTMALDECLGMLLAAFNDADLRDDTLLALVGCRGFALGEHRVVGCDVTNLYSELTHLPLLVRLPGEATAPPRCGRLVQPASLFYSLLDWFGVASRGDQSLLGAGDASEQAEAHAALTIGVDGEFAVRTSSWLLRSSGNAGSSGESTPAIELYSKPDDRWEANEIASRCPAEVADMLAQAQTLHSRLQECSSTASRD